MREQLKQWPPKTRNNKWWVVGAIASPVLLWIVWWLWLLPERRFQTDYSRSPQGASTAPAYAHRNSLITDVGTIAAVAGGMLLLFNRRIANRQKQTADLSGADLSGVDLSNADLGGVDLSNADLSRANLSNADLSHADLSGANLNGAELSGANLSHANLNGANLISASLGGTDLNFAQFKYADLSDSNLRYANLGGADLRYTNLSGADLNCAFLREANFSEANLSEALLFFINSRDVLNLEPLQLEAKPSPFLCNVALPAYSNQRDVDPNRDCALIPQLLSDRYGISLEEAQGIVDEARQHPWY